MSDPTALLLASRAYAREYISGITGSISLVCWVFLLVPQLIENYKNGRADAVSLGFLLAWFFGDVCNLAGAIWAGLLPTVIMLACYFCAADIVLLGQTIYYNRFNRMREQIGPSDPSEPLLSNRRRRSSTMSRNRRRSAARSDFLSALLRKNSPAAMFVRNAVSVLGVCIVGGVGWFIAWKTGAWTLPESEEDDGDMPLGAAMLGYTSAVLYLGARIPQIIQNARKKSCEGLSILFFILSLIGNLTYGAGILFHSTESSYVLKNLPWLIGSLGTIIQDIIIFIQFHAYKLQEKSDTSADSLGCS